MQPIIDSYNTEEEYLYIKPYLFIKGYATAKDMVNTLKALPLAREIHEGQYRKGEHNVNGKKVRLPYVLHCLKVCSTVISLNLGLPNQELDILCAAALLHDTIEDGDGKWETGPYDMVVRYGISEEVYNIVSILSKRSGASDEELSTYFNHIKLNPYALIIKLADRSHNVETLYEMKAEKLHKYTKETEDWIYPLCTYGKAHYPEMSNGITILKSKIVSLTETTEAIIALYEEKMSYPTITVDDDVQTIGGIINV